MCAQLFKLELNIIILALSLLNEVRLCLASLADIALVLDRLQCKPA